MASRRSTSPKARLRSGPIRIGTRASPLARKQAEIAAEALRAAHGLGPDDTLFVPMTASGDRVQSRPLAELGGKALWTRELDRALAAGEIDMAVHSMKDVETIRPAAFAIGAVLGRGDVRDRLVGAASIAALPRGARVATASPRRAAQLLSLRPDLEIGLIRGNVATRLAKLEAGEADATLLAAAGLERLGMTETGSAIPVDEMLPAPAQGAIGIECLAEDGELRAMLAAIDDAPSHECVSAERALLAALGADCRSPVAALALREGGRIWLRAEILTNDGSERVAGEARFAPGDVQGPAELAATLLKGAGPALRALFAGP